MAGRDPAIHEAPSGAQTEGAALRNGVDGRHNPGQAGAGHDAGENAGKLANKFILVSNLVAPDGGAAIAAGNGRVVRARLADARHFWLTDLAPLPDDKEKAAKPLDQRLSKLEASSSFTRSSARRASGSSASRRWRASLRRTSAPNRVTLPRARRISPRPISSLKWSASSPSCRA